MLTKGMEEEDQAKRWRKHDASPFTTKGEMARRRSLGGKREIRESK